MTLERFSAGVGTALDLAGIERHLRQLWDLAGPSVTRASLCNLVAVCQSEPEKETATQVVSELTLRHPCRAMVVTTLPEVPGSGLDATVTALCHLAGGGGKQVCCELIHLTATGASVGRVGSALLPLLESDLPTVLWQVGDFRADSATQIPGLEGVIDRVIFDGAEGGQPVALPRLQRLIQQQPATRFADLAWTRLTLWRKLVADCFDDPHAVAALPGFEQLRIVHGCGPRAQWRALLLAGWVGAQLGWTADQLAHRLGLECRGDEDAGGQGLLELELSGQGALVQVRKNFGEQTATARVMMPAVCALPRRQAFAPVALARLLSQELDRAGRHPGYEAALGLAAQLGAHA